LSNLRRLTGFDAYLSFGLVDSDSDSVSGSDLSDQAQRIGFRSHFMIVNNGSVYAVMIALFLILLTTRLMSTSQILNRWSCLQCEKVAEIIQVRGFNELFNFTFIVLAVGIALNVKSVSF